MNIEDYAKLIKTLAEKGFTVKQIAKQFGFTPAEVQEVLDEGKPKPPPPPPEPEPEPEERAPEPGTDPTRSRIKFLHPDGEVEPGTDPTRSRIKFLPPDDPEPEPEPTIYPERVERSEPPKGPSRLRRVAASLGRFGMAVGGYGFSASREALGNMIARDHGIIGRDLGAVISGRRGKLSALRQARAGMMGTGGGGSEPGVVRAIDSATRTSVNQIQKIEKTVDEILGKVVEAVKDATKKIVDSVEETAKLLETRLTDERESEQESYEGREAGGSNETVPGKSEGPGSGTKTAVGGAIAGAGLLASTGLAEGHLPPTQVTDPRAPGPTPVPAPAEGGVVPAPPEQKETAEKEEEEDRRAAEPEKEKTSRDLTFKADKIVFKAGQFVIPEGAAIGGPSQPAGSVQQPSYPSSPPTGSGSVPLGSPSSAPPPPVQTPGPATEGQPDHVREQSTDAPVAHRRIGITPSAPQKLNTGVDSSGVEKAKGHRKEFLSEMYKMGRKMGLNDTQARLMASQAGLESGYGAHAPGNNYFGIKAGKSWKGETQRLWTHEEINGKSVRMRDNFRKYGSTEEAMRDRVQFMQSHFGKSWGDKDFDSAVKDLHHGKYGAYATDSGYDAKITGVAAQIPRMDESQFAGGDPSTAQQVREVAPDDTGRQINSLSTEREASSSAPSSPPARVPVPTSRPSRSDDENDDHTATAIPPTRKTDHFENYPGLGRTSPHSGLGT